MPIKRRGWGTGTAYAILVSALLLACAGPVFAEGPSEEQILKALQPRNTGPVTRSLAEQRRSTEERRVLDDLRTRPAHSLSLGDRAKITEIAKDKPSIDMEINFDYNSDTVGPNALRALGRVMSNEQFKGTIFLISGHTDGKGGAEFNQDLSERRAEAVKRVLIETYKLPAETLVAVGYGKTQLKNKGYPLAGENRRVQIVNTEQQVTATAR
jgi:outer membrane protein OmpA-like peptidoglycan-associated protein